MNTNLVFALHVISILLVQSETSWILPCPRTCIADDQVLACDRVRKADLLALPTCIWNLQNTIVVELRHTRLECDCVFDNLLSALRDVNIVVYHDVSCSGDVIISCRYGQSAVTNETLSWSYVPLFDYVIDVKMANWREVFDSQYRRLWSILSRLHEPGVRYKYLTHLVKVSQRVQMRLKEMLLQTGPKDSDGGRHSRLPGISFWANVTDLNDAKETRSTGSGNLNKVIVFSSVVGVVVLLALAILLCKLEFERRKMATSRNPKDLGLDTKHQKRFNNWRSFLEKLSCYKRLKAEMGGAGKGSNPPIARQVIISQTSIQSAGTVVPQDSRSSVAVSSLTRLEQLQPEESGSQLKPLRYGKQVEDNRRSREQVLSRSLPVEDDSTSEEKAQSHNGPVEDKSSVPVEDRSRSSENVQTNDVHVPMLDRSLSIEKVRSHNVPVEDKSRGYTD